MSDAVKWLRDRVEAMTPGSWEAKRSHEGWDMVPVSYDAGLRAQEAVGLVALRNLAPAMLDVIEAADRALMDCPDSEQDTKWWNGLADAIDAFHATVREEMLS